MPSPHAKGTRTVIGIGCTAWGTWSDFADRCEFVTIVTVLRTNSGIKPVCPAQPRQLNAVTY